MRLQSLPPLFAAMLACAAPAAAQDAVPRLQDATVVAKGSTISILRLPITTPQGTIYRDVTIELQADAQGNVTLATDSAGRAVAPGMQAMAPAGAPGPVALRSVPSGSTPPAAEAPAIELPQRPSPPIMMQHFTAGTYSSADGSLITLQDRGRDLVHGVPAWSIRGEGSGVLSLLTFYSGPPFMNPRARRLHRAEIVSTDYAYGTSDEGSNGHFATGALIGVAQSGNTLRVVSFSKGCCTDLSTPTSELSFTHVGK